MNIVFCINKSYIDILSVVLLSILENNRQDFIHFYILTTDFSEEDKKNYDFLHNSYENFDISFIVPDKERFKDLQLNIDYISIETYYRYLIAELLPKEDKALYLDADIVVNGSLSELYHIDLKDNYIAGIKDTYIAKLGYKPAANFSSDSLYINAGVLLCNLSKMREDKLADKLLKNTVKHFDAIKYQDQDIINITCRGKIKEIDCIYNFTSQNVKEDKDKIKKAVIIHYTGKLKAWDKDSKNKLKKVWLKYKKAIDDLGTSKPKKEKKMFKIIKEKNGRTLYLFNKKIIHIGESNKQRILRLEKELQGLIGVMHFAITPQDMKPAVGNLRDIQLADLKILRIVHDVCLKQNLTYWIDFGTLLGALLYKGFIPWDDDIDVAMVREDYDRFIEIFNKETPDKNLKAISYTPYEGSLCNIIKVVHKDIPQVWVDIYPVDFWNIKMTEDEKLTFTEQRRNFLFEYERQKEKFKTQEEWLQSFENIKEDFLKTVQYGTQSEKPSIFWGLENLHDLYHKYAIFDYDDVFPTSEISFEGTEFKTVHNPERYMSYIFGDWQPLPTTLRVHTDVSKMKISELMKIKEYIKDENKK